MLSGWEELRLHAARVQSNSASWTYNDLETFVIRLAQKSLASLLKLQQR
jgi:hypothetical protein